jgi:integrase
MARKDARRRFGNVRQLPSGRYQASYRGPDGLRRNAPNTFTTEKLAEKWLTLKEAEILKEEWTAPEAEKMLFGPYAKKWLRERPIQETTRETYESTLKLHIEPYLGHLALGAIKPSTLRTWRSNLLDAGKPLVQAVKAYRIVRAIFNTAVKQDEILKLNPCRIPGFDVQPTKDRPEVDLEHIEALAEEMPAQFYALIMLAAYSGLRWGELVALRRSDVDLKKGTVHVWRTLAEVAGKLIFKSPKSKAGMRKVALPSSAVDVLKLHLDLNVGKDKDAMLFLGEKGALLRASSFRRAVHWDDACEAAGLPEGFHFHDTRHVGNHLAAAAGATTRELMKRLGHSTMNAALAYQDATDKRAAEIAREIERKLQQRREAAAGDGEDSDDDGSSGALAPAA